MTFFTHALASVVLAKGMGLQGEEAIYGILWGSLIDLDHIPAVWKNRRKYKMPLKEAILAEQAHSWVHEPIAAIPISGVMFLTQSPVPLIFWGLHVGMDQILLKSNKRPGYPFRKNWRTYGFWKLGGKQELVFDVILLGILLVELIWR